MRLVVIGGVAAGLSAAARARRVDKSLDVLVLEKSQAISVVACGLPYYIEGQLRSLSELVLHTAERFAAERGVRVRTGAAVSSIHHGRREVLLAGGERIGYDRLVVATGARPDRSLPGSDAAHVFTLHSLEDARRLEAFLQQRRPRRAVVIGGGYIGIEVAGALRARGLEVTLLEAGRDLLGRQDPQLTALLKAHLERHRIEVRLGAQVRAIEAGQVAGAPCELVALASGLRPNVELAAEAGVRLGPTGAIAAHELLETSLHDVYAAGDCAETFHVLTARPVWIPLGTTANKMGRIAGANAAGRRERFPGVMGTSIVRVCGLAVACTGLSVQQARQEGFDAVTAGAETEDRARYFWSTKTRADLVADRRTHRLLGGSVIGERDAAGRIDAIATALASRMTVEEFALLDFAYSPPYAPVWDPLLVAARQLAKLLD